MGVIERIKSVLGLGGSDTPATADTGRRSEREDVDVTVEHEPATASEDAVKGTETASSASEPVTRRESGSAASSDAGVETGTGSESEPEAEVGADTESEAGPATDATAADLEEIKGIGPAYAERLRDAGVESVSDLAAADAADLDEQTGIGTTRLGDWIERARQH